MVSGVRIVVAKRLKYLSTVPSQLCISFGRSPAVVYKYRLGTGDYIVRVAYSRPARRVTYAVHGVDLAFLARSGRPEPMRIIVDGNGDGNLHRRAPGQRDQLIDDR